MRDRQTLTIKERRARERAREERILDVLATSGKRLDAMKAAKRHKKKPIGELLRLTAFEGIGGETLRPIESYIPKSYNLQKQVYGLIDYLYVRYRVPSFMYQACLAQPYRTTSGDMPTDAIGTRSDPFPDKHWGYRQWFLSIAQGGSFHKQVKDIMTSREATAFLKAPNDNLIHENVWWARLTVAGIPEPIRSFLIQRILSQYYFTDPDGRLRETITFYAANHAQMNQTMLHEITDFVAWKLRNETSFRLKGRTIGSMARLSNEWHLHIQKAKLGSSVTWQGLCDPGWQYVDQATVWRAVELRSNRELLNEGRKQRHCVYSYVQHCISGRSFIFSLRGLVKFFSHYDENGEVVWGSTDELTRLTIEVNSRRGIVQVKGSLNRGPTADERKIVRRWAGEKGFTLN